MIRGGYSIVYYLILFLIVSMLTVIIIASHPETSKYLADKLLKENGVSYSKIEGSLLTGVTLYDINYADAIAVQDLHLKYNLFMLFNPTPRIQKLKVHKARIDLNKLPASEENNSTFSMFPFALSKLQLSDVQILLDDNNLTFDLNASKLHYSRQLNVKKLSMRLSTIYGDAELEGNIKSNTLFSQSAITPRPLLVEEYLSFIDGLTQTLRFDLEASLERIHMHTYLDEIKLGVDQNVSLNNADIDLMYFVQDNQLFFDTSYSLVYDEFETDIEQKGRLLPSLAYTSELNATLTRKPLDLPFKTFRVEISGDTEKIRSKLFAGSLELSLDGKEYKEFNVYAKSKGLSLSFISGLPEILKKNSIGLKADAKLELAPFSLKGKFETEGLYSIVKGSFELNKDHKLYLADVYPRPKTELWKKYPIEKFSPLQIIYFDENDRSLLNLDANRSNLTLFKKENALTGWGNIGSAYFETDGNINNGDTIMTLSAKVPSLDLFLNEFGLQDSESEFDIDGEVDINTTLDLSRDIVLKSRLNLPWYIIQSGTQTLLKGEDFSLESTMTDEKISIDSYSFAIKDHQIYSKRPSVITFDANGTIIFNEFWIYDNLLLTGLFDPMQAHGSLQVKSERFSYESKEGNVTLKADIKADFEKDGRQSIEGGLTLLDGVINYEPKNDYTISDDIIIIQELKLHGQNRPYINIHINSLKPITYKTKEIDIRFSPDVILWQEPEMPLAIYGLVTIEEGEVTGKGKLFELDKSEIYFNGANPINPYLNLNIHHQTLDYIDIEIFITNTLGSPVIILSSKPVMSQNDIMSYLLFGQPANLAFDNSGTGTNTAAVSSLLLATGLKQIFNDTTGVNVDTLNILTNEEGTLGYEIGTRFNKNMRVVYKNDTISSVILQYSITKSVRFDIDVHETGQGVSIIYIKDF